MNIKLVVVSTAKNTNKILDEIKSIAGDDLEVVLHLGDRTATFKGSSLSRMSTVQGTQGHIMENSTYSGAARDLIQNDNYFRERDVFTDHMNRTSERHKYLTHSLVDQQDFHDYHHILVDTLAQKIKECGATHCLFFNVPHLAYDTALYQVAKALNLKITIVTQSLFPNRFYSMADPADYGNFALGECVAPYKMDKGSKPDLFYMKGIKQEREAGGRISGKAILQLMAFLALKRPLKAFNPVYLWKTLWRMQEIYGSFPKWRDPFWRFFHESEFSYFEHLASYEDQEVNLDGDFVYFPLQFQPEMTTSALGGRFRDQAYAIERLAELLPKGVRILVKENPKQGAYMRGPLFFHRLNRIPSVTILPSWADTHALTSASKFVAATTGTVGWEAIRVGKPALVFGKAWYRKLHGVVEYREDLTYQEISDLIIDHSELEVSAGSLIQSSHDGVIDRHYTKIVQDFDETTNQQQVAETLWNLLNNRVSPSFHPEAPSR